MSITKLSKPAILVIATVALGVALAAWKQNSLAAAQEAAASQPEPMESVASALAAEREHLRTTTSIGTVVALRSITVRNELAGTVRRAQLTPGAVVEAGINADDLPLHQLRCRVISPAGDVAHQHLQAVLTALIQRVQLDGIRRGRSRLGRDAIQRIRLR